MVKFCTDVLGLYLATTDSQCNKAQHEATASHPCITRVYTQADNSGDPCSPSTSQRTFLKQSIRLTMGVPEIGGPFPKTSLCHPTFQTTGWDVRDMGNVRLRSQGQNRLAVHVNVLDTQLGHSLHAERSDAPMAWSRFPLPWVPSGRVLLYV